MNKEQILAITAKAVFIAIVQTAKIDVGNIDDAANDFYKAFIADKQSYEKAMKCINEMLGNTENENKDN